MTRARRELVSLEATPYYHCVCRCVRRAFLCGVMSNHYHVVLRIDRATALAWNRDEVLERWYRLFHGYPLADRYRAGQALSKAELLALDERVEIWRERLFDLGWFMRCLNEPIARQANAEDDCTGRFWEGRYKSQALLDEAAVLACMAYVDLNPIRARLADTPETSDFTSLHARIEKSKAVAANPSASLENESSPLTPKGLLPFAAKQGPNRPETALPYDFLDYLALVDWTGRAIRADKRGAIPESLAPILERLNVETDQWLETVCKFEGHYRRVLGPAEQVRAYAEALGQKWLQGIHHCLQFYRASPA